MHYQIEISAADRQLLVIAMDTRNLKHIHASSMHVRKQNMSVTHLDQISELVGMRGRVNAEGRRI
jgi:hypothetical protein